MVLVMVLVMVSLFIMVQGGGGRSGIVFGIGGCTEIMMAPALRCP